MGVFSINSFVFLSAYALTYLSFICRIFYNKHQIEHINYDIPRPGDSSERPTLAYGDGGRFDLNGDPLQVDLYPRFENPFLCGGRVEWDQREYVIEYLGKSLFHDFSKYDQPIRLEHPKPGVDERNLVKALVIFFRTGDEDMDAFTVATADVGIGCEHVAKGESGRGRVD